MRRLLIPLVLLVTPGLAHDLDHHVTRGEAVIVTLRYADGSPLAQTAVEIFHEEETNPFQTGRTDALGRLAILPDRGGTWRVRAFTEAGHGVDFHFHGDEVSNSPAPAAGACQPLSKPLAGAGILFGLFGVVALLMRRKGGVGTDGG